MGKAERWDGQWQMTQLKIQLMLTSNNQLVRTNPVLERLVARAGRRLKESHDSVTVARQIVIDLGYYLGCHHNQLPPAARDLLAVAVQIDVEHDHRAPVIKLSDHQ